ncbi:MAG: hypothetical protein BM564_11595 [Bacteroidetes bacterium MedPE-SWsnd-G2]|nr:MAG: hypothetical protein BM564_11595 [Bacteroidetes bacterium MedPE-SWsnd-G2]
MKITKAIYWGSTVLLCALMLFSAGMYFVNTEEVKTIFEGFGYPSYIVIPLAILKVAGVITILLKKNKWLTEWAYAGFFFDLVLATAAHYYAGDGLGVSFFAMFLVLASYFTANSVRPY